MKMAHIDTINHVFQHITSQLQLSSYESSLKAGLHSLIVDEVSPVILNKTLYNLRSKNVYNEYRVKSIVNHFTQKKPRLIR